MSTFLWTLAILNIILILAGIILLAFDKKGAGVLLCSSILLIIAFIIIGQYADDEFSKNANVLGLTANSNEVDVERVVADFMSESTTRKKTVNYNSVTVKDKKTGEKLSINYRYQIYSDEYSYIENYILVKVELVRPGGLRPDDYYATSKYISKEPERGKLCVSDTSVILRGYW